MHIRNYVTAKLGFHVLANPGMKNAEIIVFMYLNLLLNVTLHIYVYILVYRYLKFIAVAKGRTKHVTENVKIVSRYGSRAAAEARLRACFIFFLIKCSSSSGIVSTAYNKK